MLHSHVDNGGEKYYDIPIGYFSQKFSQRYKEEGMASKKGSNSRSRRKKKKGKGIAKLVLFLTEIVVILLLVVVGIHGYQRKVSAKIDRQEIKVEELEINELDAETVEILEGYTTIALFGIDNHEASNFTGRTDTIIVAAIDNDSKRLKLCSVYRDTLLNQTDGSYNKANAAYQAGGAKQAVAMLNSNLDLDIKNFVTVDFNAMVDIVDLLGGIELTIDSNEAAAMNGQLTVEGHQSENYIATLMETTGKNSSAVSAGTFLADGIQAVAYCRVRYTAGDDYKRAERQRTVISKIIEKAKKMDFSQVRSVISAVVSEMSTSFSDAELLDFASKMMDYELVEDVGFPFFKNTKTVSVAGDCVIPCDLQENVDYLHTLLYNDKTYTPTAAVRKISADIISKSGLSAQDADDRLYGSVPKSEMTLNAGGTAKDASDDTEAAEDEE